MYVHIVPMQMRVKWNGVEQLEAIVHISCCLQFTDDMYTVILLNNVL
jgi:hypothetical protein